MSRRNKLEKFASLETFSNVYQNFDSAQPCLTGMGGETVDLKGKWQQQYFQNDYPVVLELACGRGEYCLNIAREMEEINMVGVDAKGARIFQGARVALDESLERVVFIRSRIEFLHHFFAPSEVQGIWITFPDPFPRKGQVNRRLTSPPFLNWYRQFLHPGCPIHLKTDDPGIYDYTMKVLAATPWAHLEFYSEDIYAGPLPTPELAFQTYYERIHRAEGKRIRYIRFHLEPLENTEI